MDKLQTSAAPNTERIEAAQEDLEIGQWYWVRDEEDQGEEPAWLGCITHIGSNYVNLSGVECTARIHYDRFEESCTREVDPDTVIQGRIDRYRTNANGLLGEIKQLTARLGIAPKRELTENVTEAQNALVVAHGTKNIKAHKAALIKAKEKTLPDLFKQVEEEHEAMALWMKAKLIPMQAQAAQLRQRTATIADRIFTVELYAGLVEEITLIRDGEPADTDEKIHLFQRRHYMDEECLVNYKAGGMEFKDIEAFDRWLLRKDNRARILPLPKCIVAFKVRRERKKRNMGCLSDFIRFADLARADAFTFLYLRNGDRYYRLSTEIDFGAELFPDASKSKLLGGGKLYIKGDYGPHGIISEREYITKQERHAERKAEYKRELAAWKKLSKKQREGKTKPWYIPYANLSEYEPLTLDSVYYDDAMAEIAKAARAHNRVAVVLQGLLDRSPAFHPHPPWQLWTPKGFAMGIELLYDETRGLTDGDPPDFEAYRVRLNADLKKGVHTIGQERAWMRVEAKKENKRQENDWRIRQAFHYDYYQPYGNPGPGLVAQISGMNRDKTECDFAWERERQRVKWINDPTNLRRMMHDPSGISARFRCSAELLLNVDAYTPGDFKQFYDDPRTRAQYLKWAPLLLAAEDWHAEKAKAAKKPKKARK